MLPTLVQILFIQLFIPFRYLSLRVIIHPSYSIVGDGQSLNALISVELMALSMNSET